MKHAGIRLLPVALLGGLAMAGAGAHDDAFQRMDRDGDGAITAAEHADSARAMFAQMDANHDGRLSRAEMDAGHQTMRSQRGGMHGCGTDQDVKPAPEPQRDDNDR